MYLENGMRIIRVWIGSPYSEISSDTISLGLPCALGPEITAVVSTVTGERSEANFFTSLAKYSITMPRPVNGRIHVVQFAVSIRHDVRL